MNDEVRSVEAAHGDIARREAAELAKAETARERPHMTALQYLGVASVLTVVTGVEVWAYYVKALQGALVPIFLALSATKFALVALFYMHLRFDSRLFFWLFLFGLAVAAVLLFSLVALYQVVGH
jgi:cytochrome c oxidase subunit 4